MEAQVLLKQGAVRRVGTGTNVDILNDPWLPHVEDPYIHTEHMALVGKKVNALMVPGQNAWDVEIIEDIFDERDARLILSIPLNNTDIDSWFWNKERLGNYTVKSAYLAIQDAKNIAQSDDSKFWKQVWNLKVPLKVKHFIWRALSRCLPTKDELIVKKVSVNIMCPVCNNEPETVHHILVVCQFARLCWDHTRLMNDGGRYASFFEWLSAAFQRYRRREMEEIAMICWSLWKNRNNIVWKQGGSEFTEICRSAISTLNDWKSAQDRSYDNFLGFMTSEDGNEYWERPTEGTVKVNVDAAIFEQLGSYSFSMLARDHNGELVEAKSSCRQGSIAPECAEAIGIREALSWVKGRFTQPVVVETDCLSIVQAIRCSSVNLSYLGRVVDECKSLVSELKQRHVTLKFVKRSANTVAHFLARYNSSMADWFWSGGNVHPELCNVLRNDLKF